ncbi:molybdopterin-synthase adenylyltransferase MoeB [Telmatospirillum sp.]|uniref:HesA/MoeB/ThiF family protein n=1 Tax=Telmatospirillum sp. TaxID=2079197 RepID=UPI00285209BE|nr:molybdopterin-synthase adenylyltransferase MoeB [Telmatospirillum sp.]MDR3437537.1 molybdopterin-synthase adenylyltransferase MoeB [Telmatospirillum sp.]
MDFSEDQIRRYARHIILPEVGGIGQARLLGAKVLVIGAGGLGSPLILYLAAAGIGTIGVVDDDEVDLTNLQRQVLHSTERIGWPKVESAKAAVASINPDVTLVPHKLRLDAANAQDLVAGYDIVADGSDNFPTRFLVNDACHLAGKTLVSAAVLRFDGQLATFKAGGPCYRCLYSAPPPDDDVPSCAQAGVLGAMAGVMGSLQATEVLKEILGIGDSLSGHLLIIDALSTTIRKLRLPADPACALCGKAPTIHDLSAHGSTVHVCG